MLKGRCRRKRDDNMRITDFIRQIDWNADNNREVADNLIRDAKEYLKRVEAHIFKGNEIRSDMFMGFAEKQDEIGRLDRRRTAAHDQMLKSFAPFLALLGSETDFNEDDYRLGNRTQIADFVATIAFELLGKEPASTKEGDVRDELAEMLNKGTFSFEELDRLIGQL